ncbi:response regulator [Microbaculum marinisediminis]|nr:response regulator [Microbaculum sp. A6E488]
MMTGLEIAATPRSAMLAPAAMQHIAVVDDEADIRDTVGEYLELKGYRVSRCDGGATLRALLEADTVDLVLLDVAMPEEDGLSIARYLGANTDVAFVMVTAAGEVVDRIVGLELGADDYLAKPVDLRELLARIKTVLRRGARRAAKGGSEAVETPQRVMFGDCTLDTNAHRLIGPDGADIPITAMEFDLLRAFAEHPNRVLSRDQLLDMAHNRGWEPFDRSIDIRIARLRRKIEPDPAKPQVIKTVRGAGYMFALPG